MRRALALANTTAALFSPLGQAVQEIGDKQLHEHDGDAGGAEGGTLKGTVQRYATWPVSWHSFRRITEVVFCVVTLQHPWYCTVHTF